MSPRLIKLLLKTFIYFSVTLTDHTSWTSLLQVANSNVCGVVSGLLKFKILKATPIILSATCNVIVLYR